MPSGRTWLDPPLPAAEALARGRTFAASAGDAIPVAVYGAPLELAAVVLGAFQHAPHALDAEALSTLALPVLRRATGGAAVWAGEGVLYLALGLRDRNALMTCPPGKLLNRNVRGLLTGARALGVPTHYFGRDFLSFGVDPGIYVSWSESEPDGRVLLEAFVSLDTPFALPSALVGYPTPVEPPLRGKMPTTLRAAGLGPMPASEVLQTLADGYARAHGVAFEARALEAAELDAAAAVRASLAVDVSDGGGLTWSAPREEAIGFVSAGVRLDGWGAIDELVLGGDFMQSSGRAAALRDALVGIVPDAARVGAALDAVYGSEPGAIEGVRSLHTLRDAILDACERASAAHGAKLVTTPRPENRLARETSLYLLQHAHNPVDWYPWGAEAFARARSEDKPIFLSIGYSACHWCHVMERECFEDASIAALMNARYVNVKVDREERPDVDEIYMQAVTALTGSGGWPMSVFLTPSLEPFFGATYLPPVRRYGRASFPNLLVGLADAYRDDRDKVLQQARTLTDHIRAQAAADMRGALDGDPVERATTSLLPRFDATWGGFGGAPKFPHAGELRLLLRSHARSGDAATLHAVTHTLDRMAAGGMYDQLGGGFHRYSTDVQWRIPHFEKMLYDNGQLVVAYLEAFLVTRRPDYARVARESCEWALREMVTPEGAFASAQDADSEGEEGRFFAWTPDDLIDVLGREQGRAAALYWDVTAEGNFEDGKSALWRPRAASEVAAELGLGVEVLEARMQAARAKLLAAREQRVKPMTDDKVLVAWNGLISALALAHQLLNEPRFLDAARGAARYVLGGMRAPDGGLHATARGGRAHLSAGLDDYAFFTQALLDLYESDFNPRWLAEAEALSARVEARFADPALGGYFTTESEVAELITRSKSVHDGALPAGSGVQALNLVRLSELTFRPELAERARAVIESLAALVNRQPRAFAQLLLAHDFAARDPLQVVVSGEADAPDTARLIAAVRATFRPQRVVALATSGPHGASMPLLEGRAPGAGPARAYVCRRQTCLAPVTDADSLVNALLSR